MWIVLTGLTYVALGFIKLRWLDWNAEASWLLMLTDKRNRRCSRVWIYVMLLIVLLTWPVGLVFKKVSLARSFFHFQWRL